MRLLLDTQLLIWVSLRSRMLSAGARELIGDLENELIFSAISIWEVAIKRALGRKEFNIDPKVLRLGLKNNAYAELAFTSEHAFAIEGLPAIHKDPFDRALIAQAMSEGIILLTADSILERYSGVVRKV